MMNPELKQEWCDRLRSGKYVQGKGKLKSFNSTPEYCCLGVLGEILVDQNQATWNDSNQLRSEVTGNGGASALSLPADLRITLGLDLSVLQKAILMNDSPTEGKTFSQIADYLETDA